MNVDVLPANAQCVNRKNTGKNIFRNSKISAMKKSIFQSTILTLGFAFNTKIQRA